MKQICATAALLCALSPAARASSEPVTSQLANASLTSLEQGRIRAGGGFDFSYGDTEKATLSISPGVEYFVLDRLSVGGLLSLAHTFGEGFSYWSAGPSATYYFWKEERVAAYIGENLSYARLSRPDGITCGAMVSTTKLGVEYFLTPSVSFGPAFQWRHSFQEILFAGPLPSRNTVSVLGQFSIYF